MVANLRVFKYAVTVSLLGAVAFGFQNCAPAGDLKSDGSSSTLSTPAPGQKTVFANVRDSIFPKCISCHQHSTNFVSYSAFMANNYVIPGQPNTSPLYNAIVNGSMPQGGARLSTAEINLVQQWILDGALETTNTVPSPTPTPAPVTGTYNSLRTNIFVPRCIGCHGASAPGGGYDMSSYQTVMSRVFSVNPAASKLYTYTAGSGTGATAVAGTMPKGSAALSAAQLAAIKAWINAGATNN